MPMLSGLVKYVYKAVYEKALTGRKEMLRRQSAQHRKWKAEASLCSPLESSNSSEGSSFSLVMWPRDRHSRGRGYRLPNVRVLVR